MADDERPRVLMIDDEPFIIKAASKALQDAGFDVSQCQEWLGIARALHRTQPNVILLDFNMPVLKGDDLCAILRKHSADFDVQPRIILYSSEPEERLAAIVASCGADGYISKKTPAPQLVLKLRRLVAGSPAQSRR